MKTAIDCYERGKQKEVNADEYIRARDYPKDRFLCPECGELVYLTGSIYSNHFSHYKKTDKSEACDRRVDGVPTQSIYERIGMPIYLRKEQGNRYKLYMGFKSLPPKMLSIAEQHRMSFTILGTDLKYLISRERFSDDVTTFVPLTSIPAAGSKYHILISPREKEREVLAYWSNEADGFTQQGALFTVTESGGKKINFGDSISTETEYYWIRKQSDIPRHIHGIRMTKVGSLSLKNASYNVFKGDFSSEISDIKFSSLSNFLRESLKVHLLEKQPEFIPVWPPGIKTEEGYIFNNTNIIWGNISSGNNEAKVYVYEDGNAIPKEFNKTNGITNISLFTDYTYINIDRKHVSNGIHIRKKPFNTKGKYLYMTCENDIFATGYKTILISKDMKSIDISLPFEHSCIIIFKNNSIEFKKHVLSNEFYSPQTIKAIIFESNYFITFVVKFEIIAAEKQKTDLNALIQTMKKNNSMEKVYIPLEVKSKVIREFGASIELRKMVAEGIASIPVIKMLEEL